jgi:cathepsin H
VLAPASRPAPISRTTRASKIFAHSAGEMAHRRLLVLAVLALAAAAAAADEPGFAESNPIRAVTDRAASALESTVLAALGRTRDALRFARYAVR